MEQNNCKICNEIIDDPEDGTKDGYYHRVCYYRKYHKYKKDKSKPWEPPTYHMQVLLKPGEWFNKKQEQDTAVLLRAIRWKKYKGTWYDNKIRDKDGNWLKTLTKKHVQRRKIHSKAKQWIDSNYIPTIKYNVYKGCNDFSGDIIKEIQEQYFIKNKTIKSLSIEYNMDRKYVQYIITKTKTKVKELSNNET